MAKKAKADQDPYKLHVAAAACGVERGYFQVVDQGSGRATLWDANQVDLFTGSFANVKVFVAGLTHGCNLAGGTGHAAARQVVLGGGIMRAPKAAARLPPGQADLYGNVPRPAPQRRPKPPQPGLF